MPAIFAALGVWLATATGGLVARVLGALGMGVVSYIGVTTVFQVLIDSMNTHIGGIPSDILNLLGIAGFDVVLSLVFSSYFGVISWLIAAGGFKRLSFISSTGGV